MDTQLILVKSRLDDGYTEKYYTDLNGYKQGLYIKRYKNGKIAALINFRNNILHGECIRFFPDKSVEYKVKHVDGKRHGIYKQWNKERKLVHHLVYNNGSITNILFTIAKQIAKEI